jgi:hypothetical protein
MIAETEQINLHIVCILAYCCKTMHTFSKFLWSMLKFFHGPVTLPVHTNKQSLYLPYAYCRKVSAEFSNVNELIHVCSNISLNIHHIEKWLVDSHELALLILWHYNLQ